jgi:hypothetical protein
MSRSGLLASLTRIFFTVYIILFIGTVAQLIKQQILVIAASIWGIVVVFFNRECVEILYDNARKKVDANPKLLPYFKARLNKKVSRAICLVCAFLFILLPVFVFCNKALFYLILPIDAATILVIVLLLNLLIKTDR